MPRAPRDYREMHAAADRFEPRLARAFLRSVERMRAGVSINALYVALEQQRMPPAIYLATRNGAPLQRPAARRNVDAVMRLIVGTEDALQPCGAIVRDAFARGERLGRKQVRGLR